MADGTIDGIVRKETPIYKSVSYANNKAYLVTTPTPTYLFRQNAYSLTQAKSNYEASFPAYSITNVTPQNYLFSMPASGYSNEPSPRYNKQGMGQRWRAENRKLSLNSY